MTTLSLMDATEIVPRLWISGRWIDRLSIIATDIKYVALCARECQPSLQNWPIGVFRGQLDDVVIDKEIATEARVLGRNIATAMQNGRVLVTCNRGLNRAPLVSAIALQVSESMSAADAVALVTHRRRGSLSNESFRSWLLYGGKLYEENEHGNKSRACSIPGISRK